MAETEKNVNAHKVEDSVHQEEVLPNSSPLKNEEMDSGGSVISRLGRTFSMRQRKQGPPTEGTTGEGGFKQRLANIRRSFKKPIQKIKQPDSKSSTPDKTAVKKEDSISHYVPPKHLSAMQINDLLKNNHLEEAYENLLSMQKELQHEREALGEEGSQERLDNTETDLRLLYETLKSKMSDTVRESSVLPSCNKELLSYMANIMEQEENREGSPGGIGGWRDAWKAAVQNGVRDNLQGVKLDSHEQNTSWLSVHLDALGKKIVELLEKVKTELVSLYPPSFNVFETYVSSCHEFVEEHLKELLGKVREVENCHAMLNFIINSYHNDILGSPLLQPEMTQQKALTVSDDFLNKVKEIYCDCLQEAIHSSLSKIIASEKQDIWMNKKTPKQDGTFPTSEIHVDISRMVAAHSDNSVKIDMMLKKRVVCSCLKALECFPKRFDEEFTKQSSSLLNSDLLDVCLWVQYHFAYINSFSSLQELMEGYKDSCPEQVEQLRKEVDSVILRLCQALLKHFKSDVNPYMQNLMTKTWLNTDDDFKELVNRIENYSGLRKSLRLPPAELFANDAHYYVVKEYISELLKNKYSCKGRKNESAAAKIKEQWNELKKLFNEMGSNLDWLHPLGDQLSKIIEQEHEKDIKNHLKPLVSSYPDITKKHLSAILSFRDKGLSIEKQKIIQHFTELKQNSGSTQNAGKQEHVLFCDM